MRNVGTYTWPAPVRGWMTSGNLSQAPQDGAERLDNWFPTAQGAEMRRGSTLHATLSAAAVRLFRYVQGANSEMFGATETTIEPIGDPAAAGTAETPVLQGLTSGDWVTVQFGTSGGTYMVAVNGSDHAFFYDGTNAEPIADETIYNLEYDALTADFTVGQTVTGGTSGATAEIIAIAPDSSTAGTLKLGAITGTFQDNETITDTGGSATSNIPSGTSTASTIAITGAATADLSHLWLHKERLWFIKGGTLKAYYLPVESIGGALTEFDFAPIFKRGGALLFGANWSIDSGDGLDDKFVVVTDQGEVAVYGGTDPASATTWSLQGVYQIGEPVDKYSSFPLGGELMIVTDDGIVPLSQAISRSYSELFQAAMTAPIEDAWTKTVARRSGTDPIEATYWPKEGKLIVSTAENVDALPAQYVCNTRYNTWCRYVGWNYKCATVYNDDLYFGTDDGEVYQGEIGGTDADSAYTAHYIPKFSQLGTPQLKSVSQVSGIFRAPVAVTFKSKVLKDYEVTTLPTPAATTAPDAASVWGAGVWGTSVWGGENEKTGQQTWKSARGIGFSIAGTVSVTVNQTAPPEIELVATQIRYEAGNPL